MNNQRKAIDRTGAPSRIKRVPLQQRAQERVKAILAATEVAIVEGGYDSLSMVDIAARAGITHTSIYHYFNSLEEILATIIAGMINELESDLDAMVRQAETPQALIDTCLDGIRLSFKVYSEKPIARGIAIATRYLTTLRKMDDESNARLARMVADRFKQLAPNVDKDAIYAAMVLVVTLTTPLCELAANQPRRLQKKVLGEYLEMVRARLATVMLG